MSKRAFVIVDVQNDFVPGGALAVPEGDRVVPVINEAQKNFDLVVATQDWHPHNHGSFAANHFGRKPGEIIQLNGLTQILWPTHCVQGTKGAEFLAALDTSRVARVFQKGTAPEIDSYSGLFDNGHRKSTGLAEYLKSQGVTDVYVAGLATDYCVKFTALDCAKLGFKTHILTAGCRGVNLKPDDSRDAIEEMRRAGVSIE
ncbi:MAG: bifunctional nicotinamidase/pyrazinamidase [Verrucomicrobia bacterium]|nr:bifunctional nicotinamidase/pyrazinamidase [Verrucomicrobiota bacterium]